MSGSSAHPGGDVVSALGDQHAELEGLLADLDDDGWSRPSPCEGWDVADVVLHLAQTDEMALASLRGTFAEQLDAFGRTAAGRGDGSDTDWVNAGAGALVAAERGVSGAAVRDRWRTNAEALRAELSGRDPAARVQWLVGDMAARTLATTRLTECWIHTWDVAQALGVDLEPTDRLWYVARLAWRTLPYAFERAGRPAPGPVAVHLRGGGGAWDFAPDERPRTTVTGDAADWCLVAGQRRDPRDTTLTADGEHADAVLSLVRTFA